MSDERREALIDVVRDAARRAPDVPAVIQGDKFTTYAELEQRADEVAAALSERGIQRFATRLTDLADLFAVLTGASAVGSEPCMYPVDASDDDIAELAERLGHALIVTDADDLLGGRSGGAPEAPERVGPGSPLMILTTGTTGKRKGAHHDGARLVGKLRRHDVEPGVRWLLAYNPNQFAGVQNLLHVLVHAATLVVPESNRPAVAIDAIRRHRVTHISATPTFWRFLTALVDEDTAADLPLQQITLGGEAVPAPLLERFATLFPKAKVSQVYGSVEFGASVSVRDGLNGLPASVLERDDDADVRFKVVDGELYARSRVGMLGYYGERDSDTEDTEQWRPTGDLVEVRDGRVFFVGRKSDIINVGGVKVHPFPIEDVVGGVKGVKLARAYGRDNALTGQIVVLDVVAREGFDTEAVEDDIREACEQLPAAYRPRRIRFVDEIDVQGTKIVRRT